MKKITIVFALLFSVATLSFSQQGQRRTAEEGAEIMAKNLTNELSLNADQTSKVQAIQLETFKKTDEIRAKAMDGGDRTAMRQEVKVVNDAADVQVVAILTVDQKSKYEEWKAKRAEEMKNRGGGRGQGNNK